MYPNKRPGYSFSIPLLELKKRLLRSLLFEILSRLLNSTEADLEKYKEDLTTLHEQDAFYAHAAL